MLRCSPRGITAICLLLAAPRAAYAQSPSVARPIETLRDALVAAESNSSEIEAQRAHVKETASSQLSVARSHWLPSLTSTANAGVRRQQYDYSATSFPLPNVEGTFDTSDLQISLDQPVYRGGRTIAETKAARAAVESAAAQLSSTEQTVLSKAAKAYLTVLTDEDVVEMRSRDLDDLRKVRDQVQLQYVAGHVTRTDIYQAEARLAGSMVELRGTSAKLEQARAQYEQYVGHAAPALARPSHITSIPASLVQALEVAQEDNPDLRAAERDFQQAGYKVQDLRGQLLPSVDLQVGSRVSNNPQLQSSFSPIPSRIVDAHVLLTITVPLYQPDVSAQVSGARHGARAAELNEEAIAASVVEAIKSAWADTRSAEERVGELERVVAAYREALEGVRTEQVAGTRTVLDVLNADRDLLGARISLVNAQFDRDSAAVDLAVAMGVFNGDSLELPSNQAK